MDFSEPTITCSVTLEWLNNQGSFHRKLVYKNATLRLIRNEFRQIFVEVTPNKGVAQRLEVKEINVFKKFMSEGKASIKFQAVKCNLFISNAPPSSLMGFLRTLFVKMTGEKQKDPLNTSLRTQLLSKKPQTTEEISPVTLADLEKARAKVSKATDTTPSPSDRKRPLDKKAHTTKAPAAKKLYSESPIPNQILNVQQKEILDACLSGRNIFFTGSAGTGKSFLLRKIISALPPDVTVATASTGVAACHIGGITLHSFAGIGSGDATLERCAEMASRSASAQLWRRCKHLIIDEISMVDGIYFEKIETVARMVRKNDKPFGGIQLILCGDFFQLPPVRKSENVAPNSQTKSKHFCFQTPAWDRCVQVCYELQMVHRQTDPEFIRILNSIRIGHIGPEIVETLTKTSSQRIERNGILATRLCSHTTDADVINESKLESLSGEEKTFEAQDSDIHLSKQLDQRTSVPGKLVLKVGAQVMLVKNINVASGLVNGARGVVIGFKDGLPEVQFRNKKYLAKQEKWTVKTAGGLLLTRRQIPLRLAWAFSIHKSQGLTLDCVEMSLSKVFEAGQAYVALSRAQSLDTLRVLDFNPKQVWANPDVLQFYKRLRKRMQQMEIIPLGKSSKRRKIED